MNFILNNTYIVVPYVSTRIQSHHQLSHKKYKFNYLIFSSKYISANTAYQKLRIHRIVVLLIWQ